MAAACNCARAASYRKSSAPYRSCVSGVVTEDYAIHKYDEGGSKWMGVFHFQATAVRFHNLWLFNVIKMFSNFYLAYN